jgi:DNA-binding LacI/PurR family transcriptional regulator
MAKRADVAKMAGVSESTVSYALTGARPISEETKARIFKAIEQLDYKPNAMAQALRSGSSKMIAMLFGDQERGISDGDLEYVVAAANETRKLSYHLIL